MKSELYCISNNAAGNRPLWAEWSTDI